MTRAEFARRLGSGAVDGAAAPDARVVVVERDPRRFRAALAQAAAGRGPVFLGNPDWGPTERAAAAAVMAQRAEDFDAECGWLMIPTGGSSGVIKLARHDQNTIAAAVAGYVEFVGQPVVHAVGLLPLHHVGGLMAWMRCALTGGRFVDGDWAALRSGEAGSLASVAAPEGDGCVSIVPTQLARLLATAAGVAWLRSFQTIWVGGGPAWTELLMLGRQRGLPLAPSYGMTESAAMIAALRPARFLAGVPGVGTPLPHARIEVGAEGALVVRSPALFRGYWPVRREEESWSTGDWGRMGPNGDLTIGGRLDALINSGGEKVDPAEVEAVLREASGVDEWAVVGKPDPVWGQRVVACFAAASERTVDLENLQTVLTRRLARFKHPKQFVPVSPWPLNAAGKLDRGRLLREIALRSDGDQSAIRGPE